MARQMAMVRPVRSKPQGQGRDGQGYRLIANNKKARHDYEILDTFEAGLVLTGTEVKALREGRSSLAEAFASVAAGEVWLERAYIPEYSHGTWTNHAARRKRKLLLHRREIVKMAAETRENRMTLVPLSIYFIRGLVKIEIAIARGKREYDKRQTLIEREDRRDAERAMSAQRKRG